MNISNFLSMALLLTASSVHASQDSCEYDGKRIEVGDDISIHDPFLLQRIQTYYLEQGMTPEQAEAISFQSDWTVYVLECKRQYIYSGVNDSKIGASMLKQGSPVLMPTEHQEEWIQDILDKKIYN